MSKHPAMAQVIEVNGETYTISSRAKWECTEGPDWTQAGLLGNADARLDGLTICMDWAQGLARPATKAERVKAITADRDLIAMHVRAARA